MSKITQARKKVLFHNNFCEIILTPLEKLLGRDFQEGNVYKLLTVRHVAKLVAGNQSQATKLWHNQLGHISYETLHLLQQGAFEGVEFKGDMPICEPCMKGK